MNVIPRSTAARMRRSASSADTCFRLRCHPPIPIADTRTPVWASGRNGMDWSIVALAARVAIDAPVRYDCSVHIACRGPIRASAGVMKLNRLVAALLISSGLGLTVGCHQAVVDTDPKP